MSQIPSVLAVSPSLSPVNEQLQDSQTALSDVGVLNQTQGRVGSGASKGARCAKKPCLEELFEQVRSSPFKTGLEVSENNVRANLAEPIPTSHPHAMCGATSPSHGGLARIS